MKITTVTVNDDKKTLLASDEGNTWSALRVVGWAGVVIAAPFFLWVPIGLTGLVPSMIDVFGLVGVRIPAAVTIAGLLLAAVGFHRV